MGTTQPRKKRRPRFQLRPTFTPKVNGLIDLLAKDMGKTKNGMITFLIEYAIANILGEDSKDVHSKYAHVVDEFIEDEFGVG